MVFGRPLTRARRLRVAALVAVVCLAVPGSLWAAECKRKGSNGKERDCSATEAYGECVAEAWDARKQCYERLRYLGLLYCGDLFALDAAMCALAFPVMTILR